MSALTIKEMRARLDTLEAELNAGTRIDIERLRALEPGVVQLGSRTEERRPIRRLAKLMIRVHAGSDARALLQKALSFAPNDAFLALMLANLLAGSGEYQRALETVEPLITCDPPNSEILGKAADLNWQLGNLDESVRLQRMSAKIDPSRLKFLLNMLISTNQSEEALPIARQLLGEKPRDSEACFSCFSALWQFSTKKEEIQQARDHLFSTLNPDSVGARWRARVYKRELNYESALDELNVALRERPDDSMLLVERAELAFLIGNWGRDAKALLDGLSVPRPKPNLKLRIARVEELFSAVGGSLEEAAKDPSRFMHVRTPQSVYELAVRSAARRAPPERGGLVMIANSLMAGGAERVIANTFRHLREDPRFDWVKLYLFSLEEREGHDFYLPLTGLLPSEVEKLDRNCTIGGRFALLPMDMAKTSQAIFDQLTRDRPAVVHASLEPLTVSAGLAALEAKVPRIVLHTHNMRPTALYPDHPSPPRWRDCYRALLSREEICLVGCAQAAISDYADWLDLTNRGNLHAVYNGLNFDLFQPANGAESAQLRSTLGVSPDAPLIGTAFRFRDEKRPLMWVDAACLILRERPDARFVLFGDGPLLEETQKHVRAKGADASFIFPGLVPDLYRWLPTLDIFMLCSSSEALPNVLLEAQASGVPVVAYHVGGIGETLVDGETGILVKEDGPAPLAREVLRAIGDPAWLNSASIAGPRFVRDRFSTEKMIENISAIMLGK